MKLPSRPLEATSRAGQTAEHPVVLRSTDLDVDIRTARGHRPRRQQASFEARAGETLALLGESGCGKSMTAKAVAGLLDPVADVAGGEMELERHRSAAG